MRKDVVIPMDYPTYLVLPLGYVIHTVRHSQKDMEAIAQADGADEDEGWWDADTREIHINMELNSNRFSLVWAHEMSHALLDYYEWVERCWNKTPYGEEVPNR